MVVSRRQRTLGTGINLMTDHRDGAEIEQISAGQPSALVRKPWHTPRVIRSDMARAEVASNPPTADANIVSQIS
jgi:hypothetical protein